MKYEVTATMFSKVRIDDNDIVGILESKQKRLCGRFDCIVMRKDGTGYFYARGYGSHDIGEEDGPDASPEIIERYLAIGKTIKEFKENS